MDLDEEGVLGGVWGCFGALILQSVSKKTTHRVKKKLGFNLWFFPPPIAQKIWIFRGFLANLECAIMVSQRTTHNTNKKKQKSRSK